MNTISIHLYKEVLLGLIIGGVALAWALNGVLLADLWSELKSANMSWMISLRLCS